VSRARSDACEDNAMSIVVTENCRLCRFTECVSVCPVACFHADEDMVYIDNNVCIDCLACIPVCPVKAIMAEDDLAEDQKHWIATNAEKSKVLPVIEEKQTPLPTAEARRAELGY
jgi:ferredoxin